jgi:hypothetical protein
MIELNNIKLTQTDQAAIKTYFEKNGGYLKYKEVLQYIQLNRELMDPLNSNWLFIKPSKL